jgi:flagellar basal-body rod modification protein FlgD
MDIPAAAPTAVKSADAPLPSGSSAPSAPQTPGIADNFLDFLSILTTQLKNQNPLDPLDSNQFTQQLVQFAQVEQQVKSNDSLTSLVNIEKTAQSSQALGFIGSTVVVGGDTAQFTQDEGATWRFNLDKPVTGASITITNSSGETVFSQNADFPTGPSSFLWDGKGNDGTQFGPGQYKMTITAKDEKGNDVAISTQIQGRVDSVDLTATPPLLSIAGQTFTMDKIVRVVLPSSLPSPPSTGNGSGSDGGSDSGSKNPDGSSSGNTTK